MTTKIALTGLCALIMLVNIGCSTTKSTAKTSSTTSSNDAKTAMTDQKLPAVAEGPVDATTPHRPTWGNNISPYFN
jgi:hypothetical protein